MLALDSVYLGLVKDNWRKMVSNIQGAQMNLRMFPAIGVYILMSFALYYFIIVPRRSVYDAALLGLVIYGVFDFTNMALFKNYSLLLALTDTLWGSALFAMCAFVVMTVFRR